MERCPRPWPFREELLPTVVDTLISGSVAHVCRFVTWSVHADLREGLLLPFISSVVVLCVHGDRVVC